MWRRREESGVREETERKEKTINERRQRKAQKGGSGKMVHSRFILISFSLTSTTNVLGTTIKLYSW